MLVNLLNHVLLKVYGLYKWVTTRPDYHIHSKLMEYQISDEDADEDITHEMWNQESQFWFQDRKKFYANVTNQDDYRDHIPKRVKNIVLRIRYWYNGKIYKIATNNLNLKLPEDLNTEFSFSIPLSTVYLVDDDENPLEDITERVKIYAGPKNDFHGQEIFIKDFLNQDEDELINKFPKVKLTNSLGMSKVLSSSTNKITDLKVP